MTTYEYRNATFGSVTVWLPSCLCIFYTHFDIFEFYKNTNSYIVRISFNVLYFTIKYNEKY